MELSLQLVIIILIFFVASLSRSTFGFGDALIAMPLLALIMDIKVATPIVAFMGFFISLVILIRNWQNLEIKKIWRLIVFSLIGIPFGIIYLKDTNEFIVKLVLAIILIIFSCYKLIKPNFFRLKNDKFSFIFALLSGALGGAYNTNGPPIIIYGSLREWNPQEFRLLLQGIFLPTNLMIIIFHGLAGLWTGLVFQYFFISLPFIFIAILVGRRLNKIIPKERFVKYVYVFLLLIALVLLGDTIGF